MATPTCVFHPCETRLYRRVHKALSRRYRGGGAFGYDLRTVAPGWREAFARVGYHEPRYARPLPAPSRWLRPDPDHAGL